MRLKASPPSPYCISLATIGHHYLAKVEALHQVCWNEALPHQQPSLLHPEQCFSDYTKLEVFFNYLECLF